MHMHEGSTPSPELSWYAGSMALNIKDSETERLAAEVAERLALQGGPGNRIARWRKFLEEEAWPTLPASERGRTMSKREKEEILGYGPEGV